MGESGTESCLLFKYLDFKSGRTQLDQISVLSQFLNDLIKHGGSRQATANDCKIETHRYVNPVRRSKGIT
jgi:hypothetical protein